MSLAIGTKLGAYEILAPLGAGGMGEVYRARDTKLNRDVAIKVLLPAVANDPDRLARFSREAQVLASLNHPNIAHIYGFEELSGPAEAGHHKSVLVMELVEGEDLAERLHRGAIPIDEALPIARQIAEALEAAHDHGIIHRDLKPANIKLRADGTVKVLDFGLAKAIDPTAGSNASAMNSPTLSIHATEAGIILGTAAYMSPEQAAGKAVDKRSDLWAFGVVLMEMLTGRQTFAGETVSHVLAAVLKDQPVWTALPVDTPEAIRKLLRRCLEKDRKRRLADAADARLDLDDAMTVWPDDLAGSPVDTHVRVSSRRRLLVAWSVATVCAAGATMLAAGMFFRPAPVDAPVFRSTVVLNESLDQRAPWDRFALSPDGRLLAYTGTAETGRVALWLRALDSSVGHVLAGTELAGGPYWSPDSRWIAFHSEGKLKKVLATGGTPVTLFDSLITSESLSPGTWNGDDVIVFSARNSTALVQVSAAGGGTPSAVTTLDGSAGETHHGFPFFLPDGRHFLYTAFSGLVPLALYVGSLDSHQRVQLLDNISSAQYAAGSLVFVSGTTLMAQPFDPTTFTFRSEAAPVGERVQASAIALRASAFSVSGAGALIYQEGVSAGGNARLVWSDRTGAKTALLPGDLAPYRDLSLSSDGSRAAVSVLDSKAGVGSDLWIVDVKRGLRTRFTFDPADDFAGVWSADGADIVFNSGRKGHLDLYRKAASGAGPEEVLLADTHDKLPTSWSPDRQFILYSVTSPESGSNIWVLPLAGARKPFPFVDTPFQERWGEFSPDGRWVAYMSNESGRSEVYVAPFPGPGAKWQISQAGGSYPRWRGDGQELFYQIDDKLMVASVGGDAARMAVDAVRPLFEMRPPSGGLRSFYGVSRDGQRFLHAVTEEKSAATPLTLVTNWPALLRNDK